MNSVAKYAAVFGRAPVVVRGPDEDWQVAVCTFAPQKRSFWKSLLHVAHDQSVSITAGMSDYPMPDDPNGMWAPRVELMSVSDTLVGGGPAGKDDVPSAILQMIARDVLEQRRLVGFGHTLDLGEKFASNSAMSAVLFALPANMDDKRVRTCTRAQELLNVMPISARELALVRSDSVEALLDRFERAGVAPVFDILRPSVV